MSACLNFYLLVSNCLKGLFTVSQQLYKLIFYVPLDDAERVKSAVFATGAGAIGNYSDCSWQTEGLGQFRPLVGSNPTLGKHNVIEQVKELRIEILCTQQVMSSALAAMKEAHPYEEPAYEIISIQNHLF